MEGDDMSHAPLNGLDKTINDRGYFERILSEREKFDAERDRRYEAAFADLEDKLATERDRVNDRFAAAEDSVQAALIAQKESAAAAVDYGQKAVEKAEAAQLRVNMTQNEFRGTLADQNATVERTMMPRAETELLVKDLRGRIDELVAARNESSGQVQGQEKQAHATQVSFGRVLGIVGAVSAVFAILATLIALAVSQATQPPDPLPPPVTVTVP